MIGSSGYFEIWLMNGDSEIYIDLALEGTKARLTTTDLGAWTPGDAIADAAFTGTWKGLAVTATLSIDANGSNPTVDITIPGHSVTALVIKEVSKEMIALYTGVSPAEGAVNAEFSVFVTHGLPGDDKIFGGAEDENFEYGIDPINFTNTVTWGALTEGGVENYRNRCGVRWRSIPSHHI